MCALTSSKLVSLGSGSASNRLWLRHFDKLKACQIESELRVAMTSQLREQRERERENREQRAESREQRAERRAQRAEQRALSKEQKAKVRAGIRERKAESIEQLADSLRRELKAQDKQFGSVTSISSMIVALGGVGGRLH